MTGVVLREGELNVHERFGEGTVNRGALIGSWVGPRVLARMALRDSYFRRAVPGCFALARLHDGLFPDGSRFGIPISRAAFWLSFSRHPRALAKALWDSWKFAAGARRIRRFLAGAQGVATTSP